MHRQHISIPWFCNVLAGLSFTHTVTHTAGKRDVIKFSLKTVNLALVLVMLAALLAACGGAAPAPTAMPTACRAAGVGCARRHAEPEEEAAAGEIVGGQVNIAMWSPPNSFNPSTRTRTTACS